MKASADKRNRQAQVNRLRNREAKSEVRTSVKKFEMACEANDKAAAEAALKVACKLLDSAASKGILHHNTADRKKSRLAARFNKLA